MADKEGTFGKVFFSFLLGGLCGAALALLYAPKPGEETRKELKDKAEKTILRAKKAEEELIDKMNRVIQDISSKVNQLLKEGKEIAQEKKQRLLAAIEAGKKALEEEKKKLEDNV